MNQAINQGMQGLSAGIQVSGQYAALDQIKAVVKEPESPVQEMLSRLTALLEEAHSAMSLLDARLEPVRAPSPDSDSESSKPYATMPSQIENRLMSLQSGLGALHRRIVSARDELRI